MHPRLIRLSPKSFWRASNAQAAAQNLKLKVKNIVGGRVRQLRWARGLRQRDLAARLQILGWNAGRVAVSKIESRLRCVADYELLQLAEALGVNVADLFPREPPSTEVL